MSHDANDFDSTRRSLLKGAAVAVGGLAVGSAFISKRASAAKAPKSAMMYQNKPHGSQQCSNCIQFVPGASPTANGTCKVVEGEISPKAWCVAYTPNS